MYKTAIIDLNDLNPFVRQAGIQGHHQWPNHQRKIYDHELFYCDQGRAEIIIQGQKRMIKKGTIILIKPNTPTTLTFDCDHPPLIYWIHFDFVYRDADPHIDEYLIRKSHDLYRKQLLDPNLIRPHIMFENGFEFPDYLYVRDTQQARELFLAMINAYKNREFYWQLDCKVYILKLLKMILKQTYPETSSVHHHQGDVTGTILRYIKYHYFEKIKLEELASYIGLSKDYMGKVFKAQTGSTIISYLNAYRIQKAKQLLRHTELSIQEIALIIGFNDQYYFSKQMKKSTGYSPLRWRKQQDSL